MEHKNQEYIFKTNLNCGGCVSKVKPVLDQEAGVSEWNVDTDHPDKILKVTANGLSEQDVVSLVKQKGFLAEPVG